MNKDKSLTLDEWFDQERKRRKLDDMKKEIETDALRRALQEEGKRQRGAQ